VQDKRANCANVNFPVHANVYKNCSRKTTKALNEQLLNVRKVKATCFVTQNLSTLHISRLA